METAHPSADVHRWNGEGQRLSIESSTAVLDEIRAAAVGGLCRFPRGGVEIGGVLFGTRAGDVVRVLALRPIECEYVFGPSFALSARDGENLASLLTASVTDAVLAGLEPVGWYHSHTRSEIYLSEPDLEIYRKYFPKPWHVALVVRPEPFGSARAGFFVREPDGSVRADATYSEFVIRAPETRVRHAGAGGAVDSACETTPETPAAAETERRVEPETAGATAPAPALDPEPVAFDPEAVVQAPVAAAPESIAAAEPASPGPVPEIRKARTRHLLWGWAVVAALAGVLAWNGVGIFRPAHRPEPLALRVLDLNGQLQIDWDRNSAPVRYARSAALDIVDGTTRVHLPFNPARLRLGGVTYVRQSDNVEVRLKVASNAGAQEEFVRFMGKPSPPAPPVSPVSNPRVTPRAEALRPTRPASERPPERRKDSRERSPAGRPVVIEPVSPRPRSFNIAQLPKPAVPSSVPALPAPPLVGTASAATHAPAPPITASVALSPPPIPAPAPPKPAAPAYAGPRTGRIIWTGQLTGRGSLTIDGQRASAGYLNAELPGVPVQVSVHPAELTSRGLVVFTGSSRRGHELAGPENGWNETTYERDARRAAGLLVIDPPSAQNGWKGLSVRNDGPAVSVVVIDWTLAE